MSPRSSRPETRNPVLSLPAIATLRRMPPETREALALVLADLAKDAAARGDHHAWHRHKAPMAAYWKAVAVYARHTARAVAPRRARR